ncbi:MAG: DUF1592 domain-containing protein [Myxococcota bacterium]
MRELVMLGGIALALGCQGTVESGEHSGPPRAEIVDPRNPSQTLPAFAPAETFLRRLTVAQYSNSVADLFGMDVSVASLLEPDPVAEESFEFSDVLASEVTTSVLAIEKYDAAGRAAAEVVFSDAALRADLVGCEPEHAADPCLRNFFSRFLHRAFRRPIEAQEVDRFLTVVSVGEEELESIWSGVRYAVAAVLQSPSFIYRTELGDGGTLDGYALASRMSFFLWDSIPDDELLAAADDGSLLDDAELAAQVDRLLASPRADAPVRRFFNEWWGIDGLELLSKNPESFPAYSDGLGRAMREELDQLIGARVLDGGDVLSLFSSDRSFVNADLAAFYGIDVLGLAESELIEQWEAEAVAGSGCEAIPGFLNICSEQEVSHTFEIPAGVDRTRFALRVYGAQVGAEPVQMRVRIDGEDAGSYDVWSTEAAPETITIDRPTNPGAITVTVAFLNDFYMPPENRDLRLDWIRASALPEGGEEFVEAPLPPERRGVLTSAGLLALYARPIDTSPTQRGLFIRERILCDHIPPPPPGVEGATLRHLPVGPRSYAPRVRTPPRSAPADARIMRSIAEAPPDMAPALFRPRSLGRSRRTRRSIPVPPLRMGSFGR